MSGIVKSEAAPVGSTGNNSHNPIGVAPPTTEICLEFNLEAVGTTVTFKVQGLVADLSSPAAADWNDLAVVTADSDTPITTKAVTVVGRYYVYVSQAQSRFLKKIRLVTSANTGCTYSGNFHMKIGGA